MPKFKKDSLTGKLVGASFKTYNNTARTNNQRP